MSKIVSILYSFPKRFAVVVVVLLLTTLNAEAQIAINKLQEKNGIYYNKNKPYTGTVNLCDCTECGCIGRMEMKNGKFHGSYSYSEAGSGSTSGTYKDGKKHGEWIDNDDDDEGTITTENYKDGVLLNSKTVQAADYYKGQLAKCNEKKNEQCAAVIYQLGTAQYSQTADTGGQNFSLAMQTFQRLLKEYPNSQYAPSAKQMLPQIMYQLGVAQYSQAASAGKQDFSMAIQTFQKLLKEYPEYEPAVQQMLTQIETIKSKNP